MSAGGLTPPRDVSWYGDPRDHGAACNQCPCKGNRFVPYEKPEGERKPRLILVGEGPGRREVIQRVPFCGSTGQILNRELEGVGLSRQETWITNAAMCLAETDEENARAAECCAPRLLKELEGLDPSIPIVPMGKAAAGSVLGVKSILLSRGFVWTAKDWGVELRKAERLLESGKVLKKEGRLRVDTLRGRQGLVGRTVLPTLHPTFAFIHNENWAPVFSVDLDRVRRWAEGEIGALADSIREVKTVEELKEGGGVYLASDDPTAIDAFAAMTDPSVALGFDIETERLDPINPLKARVLCVQISDGYRTLVIGPWDARRHTKPLNALIKGRTLVMHNGFCFDQIACGRPSEGVDFSHSVLEDTLTAHHSFASFLPQKLDHVVSTFLDSSPWKITHGVRGAGEKGTAPTHVEDDTNELYLYGAKDAQLTQRAWMAMQGDLTRERSVYEFDKRRSVLYQSLQVVGYAVDRRRQLLLSRLLRRRAAALKGKMRRLARRPKFSPARLRDVRTALFKTLQAPVLNPTPKGAASTSNATLESLRTGGEGEDTKPTRVGRFCDCLLNWRTTEKSRATYIDPIPIGADKRAHYNFKPFGVITGRPAGRLLSIPRWSKSLPERPRECYIAGKGMALVYFDGAQAEARSAAALSNDKNFIDACAKDIHTRNALILFPGAEEALERDPKGKHCPRHSEKGKASARCNCGKPFRDVTKNAGFAIIYQAAPKTVFAYLRAQGFAVELSDVELMFEAMRAAYPDYDRYVRENVEFVRRNGFLRTAIVGRLIRLGYLAGPAEVANVPIQSLIADVMDTRLLDVMVPSLPPGAHMILHHYDSATFETPLRYVDSVREMILSVWAEPIRLKESIVCRQATEFVIPAEVKVARRMSEL